MDLSRAKYNLWYGIETDHNIWGNGSNEYG